MRALLPLLLSCVLGIRISGDLSIAPPNGFAVVAFLDDFAVAYDANAPVAEIEIYVERYDVDLRPIQFAVYSEDRWNQVQTDSCDCLCKYSFSYDVIDLPNNSSLSTMQLYNSNEPTFYYSSILSCNISTTLYYELHIKFQKTGFEELGYDSIGLIELYAVNTSTLWLVTLLFVLFHNFFLSSSWDTTPIVVKIFTGSILSTAFATSLMLSHYLALANNGIGELAVESVGRFMEVVSRIFFVLTLILLIHGLGITVYSLSKRAKVIFSGIMFILLSIYLSLAIWYLKLRDKTSTTYVYDEAPGIVLCGLHVMLSIFMASELLYQFSQRKKTLNSSQTYFFISLSFLFPLYVLSLPVSVFLGITFLPDYSDERVVEIVTTTINTFCIIVLAFLLRPGNLHRVFICWFEIQFSHEIIDRKEDTPLIDTSANRRKDFGTNNDFNSPSRKMSTVSYSSSRHNSIIDLENDDLDEIPAFSNQSATRTAMNQSVSTPSRSTNSNMNSPFSESQRGSFYSTMLTYSSNEASAKRTSVPIVKAPIVIGPQGDMRREMGNDLQQTLAMLGKRTGTKK
jgi:Rhodopsin-like GPCR transmembrane domain